MLHAFPGSNNVVSTIHQADCYDCLQMSDGSDGQTGSLRGFLSDFRGRTSACFPFASFRILIVYKETFHFSPRNLRIEDFTDSKQSLRPFPFHKKAIRRIHLGCNETRCFNSEFIVTAFLMDKILSLGHYPPGIFKFFCFFRIAKTPVSIALPVFLLSLNYVPDPKRQAFKSLISYKCKADLF